MCPRQCWIIPEAEPEERRRLLHKAEQSDRWALRTLKVRYRLRYWTRHGRIILT
jgi:hypothetical protein